VNERPRRPPSPEDLERELRLVRAASSPHHYDPRPTVCRLLVVGAAKVVAFSIVAASLLMAVAALVFWLFGM
jgi:hypothetical protein